MKYQCPIKYYMMFYTSIPFFIQITTTVAANVIVSVPACCDMFSSSEQRQQLTMPPLDNRSPEKTSFQLSSQSLDIRYRRAN